VLKQRSRGKGAALSLGFAVATCDLVAIIDADGSMNPEELIDFLNLFPQAEIVKGSRSKKLGGTSADLTIFRDLGNRVLTKLCNFWFKEKWTDLAYGYAVVDRKALGQLGLSSYDEMGSVFGHKSYGQGFEIEALIFCRSSKWGFRVLEVASAEHRRISGSSNLRAIRDGFRVLSAIIIEKNRSKPNES
jgi:glycosyltransferase involved in cell wall biosynthesis